MQILDSQTICCHRNGLKVTDGVHDLSRVSFSKLDISSLMSFQHISTANCKDTAYALPWHNDMSKMNEACVISKWYTRRSL